MRVNDDSLIYVSEFRKRPTDERNKIVVAVSTSLEEACVKVAWIAAQAAPQCSVIKSHKTRPVDNMFAMVSSASGLQNGVTLVNPRFTYMVAPIIDERDVESFWNLFSKFRIRVVVVRTISVPSFLLGPSLCDYYSRSSSMLAYMHTGHTQACVFAYMEPAVTGERREGLLLDTIILEASPRPELKEGVHEIAVGTCWGDVMGGSVWVNHIYSDARRTLNLPRDAFSSWKTWQDITSGHGGDGDGNSGGIHIEAHGRRIKLATYFDYKNSIRLPNVYACVKISGSRWTDNPHRLNTPHGLSTDPAYLLPMLTTLRRLCDRDEFGVVVAVPAVSASGICVSRSFNAKFPKIKIADACGIRYASIIATTLTRQSLMILANTRKRRHSQRMTDQMETPSHLFAATFCGSVMYAACMDAFSCLLPNDARHATEGTLLPQKMGRTSREFLNLFYTGSKIWKTGAYSQRSEDEEHHRGGALLDKACRDIIVSMK